MKALHFLEHGDASVLRIGEVPDPVCGPGHALLQVEAAALNQLDIWVRKGWKGLHLDWPHISGSDFAGTVLELNGEREGISVGSRVAVYPGFNLVQDEFTRSGEPTLSPGYRVFGEHVRGGHAERIAVPLENLLPLPETVAFETAASQGLVATTCWRMLFQRARLRAGDTVLVVGAGGGVNSMAIAMATLAGATVIALTSSEAKSYKARGLGARYVVNYLTNRKWERDVRELTEGRGVDLVVDNVGEATMPQSLRAARNGGTVVTVGNTSGFDLKLDNRVIFARQLTIIGSTMGSFDDFKNALTFLWERGVPALIDRIGPLSEGIELVRHLESGEQFGKVVIAG